MWNTQCYIAAALVSFADNATKSVVILGQDHGQRGKRLSFLSPPVLSRVRALSADSIMFLNNQQLVDHDAQLMLRQLLKDTDTTHRE